MFADLILASSGTSNVPISGFSIFCMGGKLLSNGSIIIAQLEVKLPIGRDIVVVLPSASTSISKVIISFTTLYSIVFPSSSKVPLVLAVSPNKFSTSCLDSCA